MKRRLICLAAALGAVLLAACSKESEEQQPTTNKGFEMTLTATIAADTDNTPDTRVAFETGAEGKGLKATWESTDKIIVYLGSLAAENRATFDYVAGANGTVEFKGTLPRTPEVGEKIYAYNDDDYMAELKHRNSSYAQQTGLLSGTNGLNEKALLYAEADYSAAGVSLAFHHLYSVFKLTFTFPTDVAVETPITNLGLSAASGLYSAASFDATDGYAISPYYSRSATLTTYSKSYNVDSNHQVTVYLRTPATTVTNIYGTAMVGSTTYVSEAMVSASVTLQRGKVYAKTITMKPDETIASSFAGGDGSAETPYQITKPSELRYMASIVASDNASRSKYYKLENDINLGDGTLEWPTIGTISDSFLGTFDGNGCTISGTMKLPEGSYGGLFGYVSGAIIKNLTMNCTIDGAKVISHCGAFVGYSYGATQLVNCTNTGSVTSGAYQIGGILGSAAAISGTSVKIVGCINTGTVTGTAKADRCGGISGSITAGNDAVIIGCINKGNVVYTGSATGVRVGGVSGFVQGNSTKNIKTIISCWSIANAITSNGASNYKGAIAGAATSSIISACYYRDLGIGIYYNWSSSSTTDGGGVIIDGNVPSAEQIKAMNDAWAAYDSARAYRFNVSTGEVEAVN